MPTRSRMPICAPVSQHCTHSRRKLNRTTAPMITRMMTTAAPTIRAAFTLPMPSAQRCAIIPSPFRTNLRGCRAGGAGAATGSPEVEVLEVGDAGLVDGADDHLAGLDVDAADPLVGVHHHPFRD